MLRPVPFANAIAAVMAVIHALGLPHALLAWTTDLAGAWRYNLQVSEWEVTHGRL